MAGSQRTDLPGYFGGLSERLDLQAEQLTPVIVHSGQMGDNDHLWFADLLRQYLPARFGVDTGFVVNRDSDDISRSFHESSAGPRSADPGIGRQCDILITDVLHNTPFCNERSFRVCPVEMVVAVVEVTRSLDAPKLRQDLDKVARVRRLGLRKQYLLRGESKLAPRGYLVAYKSQIDRQTLENVIEQLPDHERPNAILLLDDALYYRPPHEVQLRRFCKDRLFKFIALLRDQIDQFPTGPVDLKAYLPRVVPGPGAESDEDDFPYDAAASSGS